MLEHAAAEAEELRLAAIEECVDAELASGAGEELAPELVRLVAEHPLRERFHAQLMTAYARTGRPADALAVFRRLREGLARELGIEPSAGLQRLHRAVHDDP